MTYPIVPTDPGVTRQVLAQDPDMMVVAFRWRGRAWRAARHPHVQSTYVEAGRFTFFLDGAEHGVGPGDSLVIPSGARHGCICHQAGTIDTFTPRRGDFL